MDSRNIGLYEIRYEKTSEAWTTLNRLTDNKKLLSKYDF